YINHCVSRMASGASEFDFGTAVGDTTLNLTLWSGNIQLESMGDSGTDAARIEGFGELIEGTCTGGNVQASGNITTSGITNLTLDDDARIDIAQINAQVDQAITDASLATAANIAALYNFNPATDKVDVGKINSTTVIGAGTSGDKWRA
ncbi:MAG: hypothetical protein GY928_03045, partial [Colwellia sp.]|nr:hypothetical protein [Colwellia sp.]